MKHFLELKDINSAIVNEIFSIADSINDKGKFLADKCAVLFFPTSSVITRTTFEKGIASAGGLTIMFPSDALDKKTKIKDVIGYLCNWVDCIIVRHNSMDVIEEIAKYSSVPVINAMTDINHPCEILADLYAISKLRKDYLALQYTYVGCNSNIGRTWFEASQTLGFNFRQCCPSGNGYEILGATVVHEFDKALQGSDVVLTDSLQAKALEDFKPYQITVDAMSKSNSNSILNPCPPFFRGEEVSEDAINSPYFVGYKFKETLISVQQAIIFYCLSC